MYLLADCWSTFIALLIIAYINGNGSIVGLFHWSPLEHRELQILSLLLVSTSATYKKDPWISCASGLCIVFLYNQRPVSSINTFHAQKIKCYWGQKLDSGWSGISAKGFSVTTKPAHFCFYAFHDFKTSKLSSKLLHLYSLKLGRFDSEK